MLLCLSYCNCLTSEYVRLPLGCKTVWLKGFVDINNDYSITVTTTTVVSGHHDYDEGIVAF